MFLDDISFFVSGLPSRLVGKNGHYSFEFTLAERKAFLSKKKLIYRAVFRIDDVQKEVCFSEMLKESGSGISSGTDGMTAGFGFKVETYNTFSGVRTGNIAEQSELFCKKYDYSFDFSKVRVGIEKMSVKAGYNFKYQVTPIDL